jgi:hypothetical protein
MESQERAVLPSVPIGNALGQRSRTGLNDQHITQEAYCCEVSAFSAMEFESCLAYQLPPPGIVPWTAAATPLRRILLL